MAIILDIRTKAIISLYIFCLCFYIHSSLFHYNLYLLHLPKTALIDLSNIAFPLFSLLTSYLTKGYACCIRNSCKANLYFISALKVPHSFDFVLSCNLNIHTYTEDAYTQKSIYTCTHTYIHLDTHMHRHTDTYECSKTQWTTKASN